MSSINAKTTASTTFSLAVGKDRLHALPMELRAQVYANLRASDCLALAQTCQFYGNHDTELWRALVRPLRHVPLNAADAWQAREIQLMRAARLPRMRMAIVVERDVAHLQALTLAMVGLMAGMISTIVGMGQRGELGPGDLKPEQATLLGAHAIMAGLAGMMLGYAPYAGVLWSQARQARAWSVPAVIPDMHTATASEFNRSVPELKAWSRGLKDALSNRTAWRRPTVTYFWRRPLRLTFIDKQQQAHERFVFDTLHLPIPLEVALQANRPALVARSLKTVTYLTHDERHAAFGDALQRSSKYQRFVLRQPARLKSAVS